MHLRRDVRRAADDVRLRVHGCHGQLEDDRVLRGARVGHRDVLAGPEVVLPLVEEGAGLLPAEDVEAHPDLALAQLERPGLRPGHDALHLRQPLQLADPHVVPLHHRPEPERVDEHPGQPRLAAVGGRHERLDHRHVAVAVGHQPRQQIGLAVHQPDEALVPEAPRAERDRVGDPAGQELVVDRHLVAGDEPERDLGAGRPEGLALEPPAPVHHRHRVARLDARGDLLHVRPVDPEVAAGDPLDEVGPPSPPFRPGRSTR